jgi:hypothetical protein
MRGGEAPALVVGLGHVTCHEHGSKAPVVMLDEKGGSHLELGTTGSAPHHDLGLSGAGGGDAFAEQILG